jgi:DNA invertase Pin-like site-specific DNA recombinase
VKVALYIRRSTNERLQADSLKVQEQILRTYAREHEMEIVETFTDSASGTSTKHRTAFLGMVERITHGPSFSAVLVRDVSRFGRFFDVDEGAFFEVLFLGHGVKTVYCEEVFASDTSPMASLVKSVRRVMASEYSRDRSRLVRYAQSRAARLGFHSGGPPPFGMGRVMVTAGGRHVQALVRGEWKALSNHRVRLVAGDPEGVATIRRIFDLYDRDGLEASAIVTTLNGAGVRSSHGSRWYDSGVRAVLSNSRYAGLGRYRPQRSGLSDPLPVGQVEGLTVRDAPGHEAIIDLAQFRRVEARLNRGTARRSSEVLAAEARAAFEENGCVEPAMLDHLPLHCCWGTYKVRFPRGIDQALEQAFASEIADRTAGIVELLQGAMDLTQREGVWIADATIRIHIQAAFPHRRWTGVFWLAHRPPIDCDAVICTCIDRSHADQVPLYLVRSDQLANRPQGLYLRCDGRGHGPRFRVTSDTLAERVAHLRYTSGGASEMRLLQTARAHPLVNFEQLSRELEWPYHVIRKMYWSLLARGEWFPPLRRRAGRLVEIVCARCGKSRMELPTRALLLRSELCFRCATTRPRRLVRIRCPRCGREAERYPAAVKQLSSGAQTVCRLCRMRAGIKPAPVEGNSALGRASGALKGVTME